MLVLSRREGEALILETADGPVKVSIHRIDGRQAKVGIDAPQSVKVLREELLDEAETG